MREEDYYSKEVQDAIEFLKRRPHHADDLQGSDHFINSYSELKRAKELIGAKKLRKLAKDLRDTYKDEHGYYE